MLALLGCFFAHLSYSLRMARFASPFFMLDKWTFPRQHAVKRGSAAVNHSALHGMAVFFPKQINAGAIITLTKFVVIKRPQRTIRHQMAALNAIAFN